ncbi:MAG: hypothetical protein O3C51_04995 [Planctomycetota bacterium]|nr:hypothetical protein [Planctomycetota bacterium]MDA1223263.1 hypothetical protein [Planctomycetota bacterium]
MQDPTFKAPPSVVQGGTLLIKVSHDLDKIFVFVPGGTLVAVPVISGRAEFTLPPDVPGGAVVFVSDLRAPKPTTVPVQVIGGV